MIEPIMYFGIGFLFAQKFHPAMRHVGGVRRELGQRTIFNVLGPLTNPAGAEVQIVGVFDPELTEPLAQVLGELGSRAAFVVHGAGGMDELNTVGLNRVSHLKAGKVTTMTLAPEMLDLPRGDMADLAGSQHTALADTDGNKCLVTDVYRPQKRYVRRVVKRGTANAVIDGVLALLHSPRVEPVTTDATVKTSMLLVSPDEGTA